MLIASGTGAALNGHYIFFFVCYNFINLGIKLGSHILNIFSSIFFNIFRKAILKQLF